MFGYGKCEHRRWWLWHAARRESVPMSRYLGLFDTCMIEFVQIWVSLLLILVCLCFCFCFLERTWCFLFGSDLGILLALVLGF